MKISIEGFNQEYAISLKKEVDGKIIKLDCTDLVILRWFVDFYPRMKKVEINGIQYAWLSHKKLSEDLPVIDISKKAFIDRMKKLVNLKILTYEFIKESGSISVYGFGENYQNLITSNEGGILSNEQGVYDGTYKGYTLEQLPPNNINNIYNNNKTIKDKTIKDSDNNILKEENIKKEKTDLEIVFDYWNEKDIIKHREITKEIQKAYEKATKDYKLSLNDIILTIDRYAQVIKDKNYFFNYEWTLANFLSRKEGARDFLDDGSKWVNYQSWLNKSKPRNNVGGISATPEEQEEYRKHITILGENGAIQNPYANEQKDYVGDATVVNVEELFASVIDGDE